MLSDAQSKLFNAMCVRERATTARAFRSCLVCVASRCVALHCEASFDIAEQSIPETWRHHAKVGTDARFSRLHRTALQRGGRSVRSQVGMRERMSAYLAAYKNMSPQRSTSILPTFWSVDDSVEPTQHTHGRVRPWVLSLQLGMHFSAPPF